MRILAAAGGTAGHVNPMLATADQLIARGHEVIALGTAVGLEADLVPAAGLELVTIDKVPLPRRPSLDLLRLPTRLARTVGTVRTLIRDREIDAVLGFGGYVSAPAYLAARQADIPVIIQEQNARPGIANRLGARWAKGVSLTFASTPLAAKHGMTRVTGLPLRAEISGLAADRTDEARKRFRRERAAERFGLDPDDMIIVLTGGSSGAQQLNRAFAGAADVLTSRAQVLHVTGRGKEADAAGAPGDRYRVVDYVRDMEEVYAMADLVVTRAGAGMVAELAALAIPAVVVPLAIGNGEQYLNAKSAIDSGGFLHIANDAFTPDAVREQVVPLLDRQELDRRSAILRAAGVSDGAGAVADLVEDVL